MGKSSAGGEAMSVKPDDNHGAKRWPSEEECRIARAFRRLGDILVEIASDFDQEKGRSHQLSKAPEAQPEVGRFPKKKVLSIKAKGEAIK